MLSWNIALFLSLNGANSPDPALEGFIVAVAGAPVLLAPVPVCCMEVAGGLGWRVRIGRLPFC